MGKRISELTTPLTPVYNVTRSNLGSTTKVIDEKFFCSPKELLILNESIKEKIVGLNPTKYGFQFLISFTDGTYFESGHIESIEDTLATTNKKTETVVMNWTIGNQKDGIEEEMIITMRLSNPMDPFTVIQAMMSKDHLEMDKMRYQDGTVSISINGASQILAEEFFSIVQKWSKACPQPQSVTNINNKILENYDWISVFNTWVLPVLFIGASFMFLKSVQAEDIMAYSFLFFSGFILLRSLMKTFNKNIERWGVKSRRFSLFLITSGDQNQQTKIASNSRNSMIKLVCSVSLTFILNVCAGGLIVYLFN